jgi:gamma-glutamylaminecyclotransferase
MNLVFVYGSLLSGLQNHRVLAGARFVDYGKTAESYVMGSLGSFPGVARGGSDAICGELYEVDDEVLARLDRLEGHPRFYCRALAPIFVRNMWAEAFIYLLPKTRVVRMPRVRNGDWRKHREEEELTA